MRGNCDNPMMSEDLIQMVNDVGRIQQEPIRKSSILNLYLTNKPGPVNNNTTILGIYYHIMVVVDSVLNETAKDSIEIH